MRFGAQRFLPEAVGTSSERLQALVDSLVGAGAPASVPIPVAEMRALRDLHFWRVRGSYELAAPWSRVDLLSSLRGSTRIAWRIASDGEELTAAIGTSSSHARILHRALVGLFPRGSVLSIGTPGVPESHRSAGCLCGVPVPDRTTAVSSARDAALDAVLDTMRGESFTITVSAEPDDVSVGALLDQLRDSAHEIDRIYQPTMAHSPMPQLAVTARRLINAGVERCELGAVGGMWKTSVIVTSARHELTSCILSHLSSRLSDPDSQRPWPLRSRICTTSASAAPDGTTLLTSQEVAAYWMLPERDRCGFPVVPRVRFSVDHRRQAGACLELGAVLDGESATSTQLGIALPVLQRHSVVVGHSGSGKTTTIQHLLSELREHGAPWLAIEPAKEEYRAIVDGRPGCRAFSVGEIPDGNSLPFRLNPLSFPCGFPFHTHIDLLKQAFVAAFGLMPPAPYLLESALHRAYESAGWDLGTGAHANGHDALAFPTLSDVAAKIDDVVSEAGYSDEIAANLRGALKTRIGNLCSGPKGFALDTHWSVPDSILFESPCVIGLRRLGSDEEKAFVMGLLVTRLYELRETATSPFSSCRHVLVIEEAHRLLRRTAERSVEEGNMAHQAIQGFINALAELRAYGQAVIVVEQIPSKLAPDVVKHCGLKIVHRLTARDDCDAIGDSMALTPEQKRELTRLQTGECVVLGDFMTTAARVHVPAPAAFVAEPSEPRRSEAGAADAVQAECVRRSIARFRLGRRLDAPELRRAAERHLVECMLAAARGQVPGVRSMPITEEPELIGGALEYALLGRARFYGWREQVFESLCATLSKHPERLGEQLLSEVRASKRAAQCRHCTAQCITACEAAAVSSDPRLRSRVSEVLEGDADDWRQGLVEAVSEACERRFGSGLDLPEGFVRCALSRTLSAMGVDEASRRRVALWATSLDAEDVEDGQQRRAS